MLIDMIHDNHGEPPFKTKYRDPAVLREMGYEAIVIPDALAAIPAAHVGLPTGMQTVPGGVNARKPNDVENEIDTQIRQALACDMKVFFYGDALLLPRNVVERRPEAYLCEEAPGSSNGPRLCPGKPAVFEAISDQIHELFDRWPGAAGLIMRTGEVYPEATPHMMGSPLYAGNCPHCREISLRDRLTRFITAMYNTVILELHKTYIHRAWQPAIPGLPNMHDDAAVYAAISKELPPSPHLCFSFKFTRGDFRHKTSGNPAAGFNPCLLADERPKWIEFQCEREFEGKGAFPNFQAPLWGEFLKHLMAAGNLSDTALRERFSIWGWSRGGGWGGPYVQREEWIDANVFALGELYKRPTELPTEVATTWASGAFGVAASAAPVPAMSELLMLSVQTIRKLLYVGNEALNDSPPWVRDDLIDVEAIWTTAMTTVGIGAADVAVMQKEEALRHVDRLRYLFDTVASSEIANKSQARALSNSLTYFSSFAGTVANLFNGFVRFAQWSRGGRTDAAMAEKASRLLEHAQAHWQHHTQRHALLPGAPSVFQENTLWDRTNDCLEQLQNTSA